MNRNSFIYKFILSAIGTTVYLLFFNQGDFNIIDIIVIFIGTFLILSLWHWITDGVFTKKNITKDTDEIDHPVTQIENTLHAVNVQKHYGKAYNPKLLETCDCGSTLFRIYNEDTEQGTYIQFICVKCNQKATGLEFNWKEVKP